MTKPNKEIRRHCACWYSCHKDFRQIFAPYQELRMDGGWGRRCADISSVSWNIADTQTSAWWNPLRLVKVALRRSAHVQQFYLRYAPILTSRIERMARCTIELRQLLIRAWLICGGRLIRTRQRPNHIQARPLCNLTSYRWRCRSQLNLQQSSAVCNLSRPEGFFPGQLVFTGNPHHWRGARRKST